MRILVVEDERPLADVVVEGLRDAGFAVDAAYDGLDAAAKLDLYPYDVVVLDRDLPGLHGDALCTSITGSQRTSMVLMLTAADAPAERVSGLGLVKVTIARLRRKLGEPPIIHTISGIGYRV